MRIVDYVNDVDVRIQITPYHHFVKENFFKHDFYCELVNVLEGYLDQNKFRPIGEVGYQKLKYDGFYCYPDPREITYPFTFLYTRVWKDFISALFDVKTSDEVLTGFHRHIPPGTDGWPHCDLGLCSFVEDRGFDNLNHWAGQCVYADDTAHRQPHTFKRFRSIALIYYLGSNEVWRDGDGGETGMYTSYDPKDLVKKVPPTNNTIFAFAISPMSWHGFIANKRFPRNTIIQWFHSPPSYVMKKYEDLVRARIEQGMPPYEYWTDPNEEKFDVKLDSTYSKYFDD